MSLLQRLLDFYDSNQEEFILPNNNKILSIWFTIINQFILPDIVPIVNSLQKNIIDKNAIALACLFCTFRPIHHFVDWLRESPTIVLSRILYWLLKRFDSNHNRSVEEIVDAGQTLLFYSKESFTLVRQFLYLPSHSILTNEYIRSHHIEPAFVDSIQQYTFIPSCYYLSREDYASILQLQVKPSQIPNAGMGVFTTVDLDSGTEGKYLLDYEGEPMTVQQYQQMYEQTKNPIFTGIDFKIDKKTYIWRGIPGTLGCTINSSLTKKDANCEYKDFSKWNINEKTNTFYESHTIQVWIKPNQKIAAGSELFTYYWNNSFKQHSTMEDEIKELETPCKICHELYSYTDIQSSAYDPMLICSTCEQGYHLLCLYNDYIDVDLEEIQNEHLDWYCSTCGHGNVTNNSNINIIPRRRDVLEFKQLLAGKVSMYQFIRYKIQELGLVKREVNGENGLFCTKHISKKTAVIVYYGQYLTSTAHKEMEEKYTIENKKQYILQFPKTVTIQNKSTKKNMNIVAIDATEIGTLPMEKGVLDLARYINDAPNNGKGYASTQKLANLKLTGNMSHDGMDYYLMFHSTRDIEAEEELYFDYGDYEPENLVWRIRQH